MLLKEEKDLLLRIEESLSCVSCKELVSHCVVLRCQHFLCRKCLQIQPNLCPKCFQVIRKSTETAASQFVQDIVDAFKTFCDSTTLQAISYSDLKQENEASQRLVTAITPIVGSSNEHNVNLPAIQPIINNRNDDHISGQHAMKREASCGITFSEQTLQSNTQLSSSLLTPLPDGSLPDTFRTFSSSCADWISDIQTTKEEIERLIANGSDIPLSQASDGSKCIDTANKRLIPFPNNAMLPLPVIAEVDPRHSTAILELSMQRGWIQTSKNKKIQFSDPMKVFVTDSNSLASISGRRTIPCMKAMLLGCQIVHIRWLQESLSAGVLLDPQQYHCVDVPQQGMRSLFKDYDFFVIESSHAALQDMVTTKDIVWMIEIGGGKILKKRSIDNYFPQRRQHINLHMQLKSRNPLIVLADKEDYFEENLSISWVFDAICSMKIPASFESYRV